MWSVFFAIYITKIYSNIKYIKVDKKQINLVKLYEFKEGYNCYESKGILKA